MRIILCFLLSLAAAPAWAEWVEVAATDASTFYINSASIRKNGNFRKVWVIQDLKQRDENGVRSRRVLDEIDCKEERRRFLAISSHSEPMAGGETLSSKDGVSEWNAIPPDSTAETMLQRVCAK